MGNIYTDGQYLEATQTWHAEDSPWKARQIKKIIDKNKLQPNSIAEIGCGSGSILDELSKKPELQHVFLKDTTYRPRQLKLRINWETRESDFFKMTSYQKVMKNILMF